jgi:GTP-binding protein
LINDACWFVDLPGYGYARAPKDVQAQWSDAAGEYLEKSDQLALSIHLIDSRHEPTTKDLQLHEWLLHHDRAHVIVATKADKLSNNELAKNIARAKKVLNTSSLIAYSSVTGPWRERSLAGDQRRHKKLNAKKDAGHSFVNTWDLHFLHFCLE